MPLASYQTSVPVVVDDAKCIAGKGCTVCVDVCPLDVLRISPDFRPAYDPLLRMAVALADSDPTAARTLLDELQRLQPARPEALLALRVLAEQHN